MKPAVHLTIEAEDIVQETFVKAIQAFRRNPDIGTPEA